MKIRNHKDFWAGVLFMSFGAFFVVFSAQYKIGTAAKMEPGYFPTLVGAIVIILGLITTAGSMTSKSAVEKVDRLNMGVLLLLMGSVVAFGLLINPLGLIASMFILIFMSSCASHEFTLKTALITSAALILLCLSLFVWLLKLQMPLWPSLFLH